MKRLSAFILYLALALSLPAHASELPIISISDVQVTEGDSGNSAAHFKVSLSHTTDHNVVVYYTTRRLKGEDNAADSSDFPATTGILHFKKNSSRLSQPVDITIHGDTLVETDERFALDLRLDKSSRNLARLERKTAFATIINDDASGISITAVDSFSGEDGDEAILEIRLSSSSRGNVFVELTSDNPAEGIPPALIQIPATTGHALVSIPGIDDEVDDDDVQYTIITGEITSVDPYYDQLGSDDLGNITLTNVDNDTPSSVALTKIDRATGQNAQHITVEDINIIDDVAGAQLRWLNFYQSIIGNRSPGSLNTAETIQAMLDSSHRLQSYCVQHSAPPPEYSDLDIMGLRVAELPELSEQQLLDSFNHLLELLKECPETIRPLQQRLDTLERLFKLAADNDFSPPDVSDYSHFYLQGFDSLPGVSPETIVLALNDFVRHSNEDGSQVNRQEKLQTWLDALLQIFDQADGKASTQPSVDTYHTLALEGVTEEQQLEINLLLARGPDDGTGITGKDAIQAVINHVIQAMNTLINYADSNGASITPLELTYDHLSLGHINRRNISTVNAIIASLPAQQVNTPAKLRRIIRSTLKITNTDDVALATVADYQTIGISGINSIDDLTQSQVLDVINDSAGHLQPEHPEEIQQLVNDVRNLLDQSDAQSDINLSPQSYTALGISGANDRIINALNLSLREAASQRQSPLSRQDIQALVEACNNALKRIRDYAADPAKTPPSADDFAKLHIRHTSPRGIVVINRFIPHAGAINIADEQDVQALVTALHRIRGLWDSNTLTPPSSADYTQLGLINIDVNNSTQLTRQLQRTPVSLQHLSPETLQAMIDQLDAATQTADEPIEENPGDAPEEPDLFTEQIENLEF